jgi:hypothetical protein
LTPIVGGIESLSMQLASEILEREIKEKNTESIDSLMNGKMKILKVIL